MSEDRKQFDWKKAFSFLFILAVLAFVIVVAFSNGELEDVWGTLLTLAPKWLLVAFLGWCACFVFDGISLYALLRDQKNPISLGAAIFVALIGLFYNNIDPGASGGQLMQVYYLKKKNVSIGISSSVLSVKFFCSQLVMVAMAILVWALNPAFVTEQLDGYRWIIVVGISINFFSVPAILLIAMYPPLVRAIVRFFIRIGVKLRLVKNAEKTTESAYRMIDIYHDSMREIAKKPQQILLQFLLSALSLIGLLSVPVAVYYAFGLSGTPWYHIFAVSVLLFLSVSYTPLPGASGAQEGGFLVFFQGIFTGGTLTLALLVWRFMSYYLFLLFGAVMTVVSGLLARRKRLKNG